MSSADVEEQQEEKKQKKSQTHKLGEDGGWGKKARVPSPDWPDTATTTAHYSCVCFFVFFLTTRQEPCSLHTCLVFSFEETSFLKRKLKKCSQKGCILCSLCAFHTTIYVAVQVTLILCDR